MNADHRYQRAAVKLSLVLLVIAGSLLSTFVFNDTRLAVPVAHASYTCGQGCPPFYGGDSTLMNNATANIWPQGSGPYCGVENAQALVNYDDELAGVGMHFASQNDQYTTASNNYAASARSQWGYVLASGNNVAGESNISYDFGTDPRSIANMAYTYSINNRWFHDEIYRWQFDNRSQPSFNTQVQQATTWVAYALEQWSEPVSVTINAGQHSVIVSGVYSNTDPMNTFPAAIVAVVFRDPMDNNRYAVDFPTWESGNFSVSSGVYSLWSLYYGPAQNNGDPEPAIGWYAPNGTYPEHWFGGFTWIQRDGNYNNGQWSPDLAFHNQVVEMTTP